MKIKLLLILLVAALSFAARSQIKVINLPQNIKFGHISAIDFDNDGDLDLVVGGEENGSSIQVYLNDGAGNYTLKASPLRSLQRPSFSWADINQDGIPDLITNGFGLPANFTNPIIQGADPYVTQKDGFYYFMVTQGNSIKLWKTKNMSAIGTAVSKTVYTPTNGAADSQNVWAPEINFFDGKWYIYYTAGDGSDNTQRTWVLENSNADPMAGTWVAKGRLYTANSDFWAIDGNVMEYGGNRYFLWSGRPNQLSGDYTQSIYIAKMTNPWTLEGNATRISTPTYGWEKNGFGVNEAPEFLLNGNKAFVTFSASFCGTDDYALGLLSLNENGDPLRVQDWSKNTQPVFVKNPSANAFGPGHNSFFTSPDGTENWLIYHANSLTSQGCSSNRNVRMQKFTFNVNGSPNFGLPVAVGVAVKSPSGEK
jgi:GH43 family beta-xylosidase